MADKVPRPPAIDPAAVEARTSSIYPASFLEGVEGREKRALGNALGLTKYGVNLVRVPPGLMSAQRHWHSHEDEFVFVIEGELVLVTDAGEQVLTAGMAAGFPAGAADGHHLINRSEADAVYLEVGDRNENDETTYPDIDLHLRRIDGRFVFLHKDGMPY